MSAKTNTTTRNPSRKRRARRNPRRKKNGAGLGAFVGSLVGVAAEGVLVAAGVASGVTVPLGLALSVVGGAVGGHYAAPSDRKDRGATGGGIGGVFGTVGAAIGGYIGGRKPDRKHNGSRALDTAVVVAMTGAAAVLGAGYYMKRRKRNAALPSKQPGATPDNQGAGPALPPSQIPQAVLDAELAKGGVPLQPWWKTVQARAYRDHFIRIDEDVRFVQPYMNAEGQTCVQTNVRWVVVAGPATWIATGKLDRANACSLLTANGVQEAQRQIYDRATLAAMDWIDIAFPKPKAA